MKVTNEELNSILINFMPTIKKMVSKYNAQQNNNEDLVQELSFQVIGLLENYDPAKCKSLNGYLAFCTRHNLWTLLTKQNKNSAISLEQIIETKGDIFGYKSCKDSILTSLDREDELEKIKLYLSKQEAELLSLTLDGYDFIDIQKMMCITPNARAVIINHIKTKLKKVREE